MKKIYHFSHMTIISLLMLLLCICGIAARIIKINIYRHAKPLSYFSEDSLKDGKYVSGTITSYVVSPLKPKDIDADYSYFGNLHDVLTDKEYLGYLIPFNEEQYICIWIDEPEALALLRKTQDGLHVNVPFVGQIQWETFPSEYTDEQLGFNHNKVITNYVIFQKNPNSEIRWIKVYLLGIAISFLLYWFKGRIEVSEIVYKNNR